MQQAWTADGLRASLTDANNNTTGFTYDGFDRLSITTFALGGTEALTYNASIASCTSSTWPATLTLRQTLAMTPVLSIRKVARSMPMYLRP